MTQQGPVRATARSFLALVLLYSSATTTSAFVIASPAQVPRNVLMADKDSISITDIEFAEPGRNPDRPELPELKGDYDWDAKFAGDDDWITENVPGKIVLGEMELIKQATALDKLEEEWRKERMEREFEESKKVGWVSQAELLNGRTAMFFLVTGLLTELWTGVSLPGQVEEMLRIGGFLGYD